MGKTLKASSSSKNDSKLRFNTSGSSTLATLFAVASAVVMVAIIGFLFQISNRVNDINTGKVADGRLSENVAHYNDPAPTFKHYVKAPGFVGYLVGNADTATALTVDPSDCGTGTFATAIDAQGNLSCEADTDDLSSVNAITLNGNSSAFFQNASNLTTGTVSGARLSDHVTMQGNNFNGPNQLVLLNADGSLPAVSGANLTNLNASALTTGTVADARLSANVAKYNDASPTFTSPVTAPVFNGNLNGNATTATALAADPTDCAIGSFANAISSTGDLTCSNDGAALINLDASNITAGTLSDARLSANVTLQGNTFNGANQLVQLDAAGALPALDGAALTNLTGANVTGTVSNATDAVNFTGALSGDVTGTQTATVVSNVNDAALSANVALLDGSNGLTFTGNLSATTVSGDGSGLTNLTGATVVGPVATADALTLDPADCATDTYATAVDAQANLTCAGITDAALSANVALLDGTNGLDFTGGGTLIADAFSGDGSVLTNLTGANVTGTVANAQDAVNFTGTLAGDVTGTQNATVVANVSDAALSSTVTLMGNTFNGPSQLVQLNGGGAFTALDAGNLTNLTGANVQGDITGNASNVTGIVADANVADNLTINGGTINNTVIGGATPAAGTFTTLNTTGAATLNSLAVTNDATVGNALTVAGVSALNGAVTVNNSLTVTGASSLSTVTISGTTTHNGATTFNGTATFNNTLSGNAIVDFSGATRMTAPVTAVVITDGVTGCTTAGALTFSTNGNFYGCDGAVWRQLNN